MKPKNLKFPFTWKERRPALHEGVLIVPQHYDRHGEWEDSRGLFRTMRPISIEYCSGNGDWIIDRAKRFPTHLWVAVEKQFERVRKIWSKMHNEGVENLLIVCGEAQTFTNHYLPEGCADEVFVNFPDPWPKERHAKHRLIQEPFINEVSRVIKETGVVTLVTDDPTYRDQIVHVMSKSSGWKSRFPAPFYVEEWKDYGNSWFEELWREKGRNIHYIQYGRS